MSRAALAFSTLLATASLVSGPVEGHGYDRYEEHDRHERRSHDRHRGYNPRYYQNEKIRDTFSVCAPVGDSDRLFMRGDFSITARPEELRDTRRDLAQEFSWLASGASPEQVRNGKMSREIRNIVRDLRYATETRITGSIPPVIFADPYCSTIVRYRR